MLKPYKREKKSKCPIFHLIRILFVLSVSPFVSASFEDGRNPYQFFHSVGENDKRDRFFNYLSSRSNFVLSVKFPSRGAAEDIVGLSLSLTINLRAVTA